MAGFATGYRQNTLALLVLVLNCLMNLIYPFMKTELCLPWGEDEINDITTAAITALVDEDLLTRSRRKKVLKRPPAGSAKAYQLLMLGESMVPMLQRFYLVIAILVRHGSGTLSRATVYAFCSSRTSCCARSAYSDRIGCCDAGHLAKELQ